MKRVLTVVGARPQFIKAAAITRAISKSSVFEEVMIHTGQHYDRNMSEVFFDELAIPEPKINLSMGGGAHGKSTGDMLAALEAIMIEQSPDWVLVYGDTNSTLAGALAAAKLNVPIAHVEAGLRSFNRRMPEEINRVVTDHLSELLFCPTKSAVSCLAREGITSGVQHVGDVMLDAVRFYGKRLPDVTHRDYLLLTLHRAENVDDKEVFSRILAGLAGLQYQLVLPLHPRTKLRLEQFGLALPSNVEVIAPVSYRNMLSLLDGCSLVITDSGGLQKEAYFMNRACVTLREETEWSELVEAGVNTLVGSNPTLLMRAVEDSLGKQLSYVAEYGDGNAADKIISAIELEA